MRYSTENKRYYSIGEVASKFNVKPSLIRFWEQEFQTLNPKKNSRGNRKFTIKDIEKALQNKNIYLVEQLSRKFNNT